MSPSSPRLLSLGPGGAGVGRIGGGTFSPPVRVGVGKPPLLFSQDFAGPGPVGELLRKLGPPRRGTFLPPSSPRLPSLGSGGAGVGRIGGGTFSPPEGVGVGKPPLLFSQDFAGPGPVGELLKEGLSCPPVPRAGQAYRLALMGLPPPNPPGSAIGNRLRRRLETAAPSATGMSPLLHQRRSKRSRVITLVQAAMKSWTNSSFASSAA